MGLWREHLPYQSAVDVTASEQKVYCATIHSLFSVDLKTNEIERFSKIAGLSETGISCIQFDALSKRLYVAYNNSNIDVLDQSGIHNIPDLKRSNNPGNKSIYQIYPDNDLCYLATGLGVVVMNAKKLEISDSWLIGNNGEAVKTSGFCKAGGYFYAATDQGLKKISITGSNPADFHNWQTISGANGLAAAPCTQVVSIGSQIIAVQHDSLFVTQGNNWNLFFANGWPVTNINVSENKVFVSERMPNGTSQVVILNSDGTVARIIQQSAIILYPKKAISIDGEPWIADLYGGLSHWQGNSFEQYKPNSPGDIALGAMLVRNNILYATAGTVNDSWNYQYNRSGIFRMDNNYWTNFNQFFYPQLDTLMDFITVAADPRDGTVWAGSFGGGLLHIKKDDQLEILKQNTPLMSPAGDPGSYRVSGLAFDDDHNLWISNFGSVHQLLVLKDDGSWQSFSTPFSLFENAVAQIVIDDANQKWIVAPQGNGLLVFDHGQDIQNTGDDRWKLISIGAGAGNLPSNEVRCIAKDKNGFIWVGTANGIAVLQCAQDVFKGGCDAVWPVVKEGSFTNYLFSGRDIRSIAVDGADRKWVATSNGAWLISAAGDQVLAHFTQDNSPLLSDDVRSIAISGQTGEVFFGTANGICSFRGTATEASENKDQVLVFPNPVKPDYQGTIGIRGLPENSIVKITETNGRLVFQTRALGGQAVWDGRDYNGRRAVSGVYLVLALDENKQEKVVTKIVVVSR